MSSALSQFLMVAIGFLGLGFLLCVFRAVKGPSMFDRILAFDCAVLHLLGALLVMSILERSASYMDVILVVGLLGFLGTVSFAAYLEGTLVD